MNGRDEKVSQVRLTAVQYIVLAIFMILAYGLWRVRSSANAKGTLAAAARRCGFAQ